MKTDIRVNANAAIIQNDKILLIKFSDQNGVHYNLPGGGVDFGESIPIALVRECQEEACADVEVRDLILCWQYVPELENFKFGSRQKVGLIFKCDLKSNSNPHMPIKPDTNQVGVEWVSVEELMSSTAAFPPLYPELGKQLFQALQENNRIDFLASSRELQ